MKKRTLFNGAVILGIILALAVFPAGAWSKEKIEQKFQKTEALEKDGKVIVRNVSGMIEIHGWAEAQVKIDAVKTSKADTKEKALANADLVKIEVVKTGSVLRIESRYPEGRGKHNDISVSIDYKIWVPRSASVDFRNVSGDVKAEGLTAGVRGEVISGELAVSDIEGEIGLKSVSGDVTAQRIKGSVESETTSGSITLKDISAARSVRVKVLSGNVSYEGGIEKAGHYAFEAFSGDVVVLIPASAGFEFEAGTFSGSIESEFPVTVSGKISQRDMRGTVNGGGASLEMKTFSGTVRLRKK